MLWRSILKQVAWYAGTVILLAILVYVFRLRSLVWVPWLVALVWGAALVFLLRPAGELETRLKAYLDQALAYQAQIDSLIRSSQARRDSAALASLAGQVQQWTEAIQDLVRRISSLQQDPLIRQDKKAVPAAIAELEARLNRETEPSIRSQLERTLANRRKQLASLQGLQTIITRAEIQIESTLSMLGTIYSQLLTGQSTSHVADYSRLSAEVDEEVRLLQDQLEALREVKLGQE